MNYKDEITQGVTAGLTATRILREIKALGYSGGKTILSEMVSSLRSQAPLQKRKQVKRRFETPVGLELQVDWSPGSVLIANKLVDIHVLGMVLCSSRKVFYSIHRNEQMSTLLEGLATGFEYFGGCTVRCVFDNMTTIVLGRIGRDRKPIWNPRFIEFVRYYGFEPFLCAVRDPNRKGKKEKAFRLVFADFLKGTAFDSWDDMQQRLRVWLDKTPGVGNLRTHGTTGLVPNEAYLSEKDLLIALPDRRFAVYKEELRAVDQDSTLSVKGIRYTVPSVLGCRQAVVRLFSEYFEVFDQRGKLHLSRKYLDTTVNPGKLVIDSTHYEGLHRKPGRGEGIRLDDAFIKRFPSLQILVDGLKTKLKTIAPLHLNALLRLADTYGQDAFLAAATRVQKFRRFSHYAVERILKKKYPLVPEDSAAPGTGIGSILVSEVEDGDMDDYSGLDTLPATTSNGDKE